MSEIKSNIEIDDIVNQIIEKPQYKGLVLFNEMRYSEAIEEYKKGLTTEDVDEKKEILANIGDSYQMLKNFSEAINYYNESLKVDPDYLYAIEMLGGVYMVGINDYEKGMEYNLKAEKLGTSNSCVYYNIACYYSVKMDINKAFEYLDASIRYGYMDIENIESDSDLDSLRSDVRFMFLINKIQSRDACKKTNNSDNL